MAIHPSPQLLSASTMTGDRVKNSAGEDLGYIKELMIDTASGRVVYAVLSFGGLVGFGDKLFAIPWQSMRLDAEDHAFVLEIDKDVLQNAPGFDKDHWPSMSDLGWQRDLYGYYGLTPYWEEESYLG